MESDHTEHSTTDEEHGAYHEHQSNQTPVLKHDIDAGVKLEWDSDNETHHKLPLSKSKRNHKAMTGTSTTQSYNESNLRKRQPTGHSSHNNARRVFHKTDRTSSVTASETATYISEHGVEERLSEEDEIEQPLPQYLQDRFRGVKQSAAGCPAGPIRLPPICEVDSYRLSSEIRRKPEFIGTSPCNPDEDVEFWSRGPNTASQKHKPLYKIGTLPACIAKWLREYQIEGAHFLLERFVWQQGGILGDDMGLGKTIQVIAFMTAAFGKTGESRDLHHRRAVRLSDSTNWYPRILIICPGTLMDNWASELTTWGFWQVDRYHGTTTNREAVLSAAKSGSIEIVITTYHTYRLNHEQINLVDWDCVVADECHAIKERTSLITQAMNNVNALCRIGLTGTAIQNNYNELWTLLNWSNPGAVSSFSSWKTLISKPLQRGQAHDATTYDHGVGRRTALALKNELLPRFFLRRWKSLIADQLPKKSDRVVFCPLTTLQANAYKSFVASPLVEYIRDAGKICACGSGQKAGWCCRKYIDNDSSKPWNHFSFPAIHALRSIANHLALLIPDNTGDQAKYDRALHIMQLALPDHWHSMMRQKDSVYNLNNRAYCGKFEVLLKLLAWWHEHGDKVLIFSHSVKLLRGLQLLFSSTSYSCSYLDGTMKYEDRTHEVEKFNSDDQQFVFLISIRAGGVGLNITSANKVVILDPNWNPSHDLQAQDRAYRIGQTRDVEVFRLISIGTVEETVYARQIYKQQQASIGYSASLERRYFSGVQGDKGKKGELFGLENLFTYHEDQVVLQSIVNKTNIAESKAGLLVADINLNDSQEQLLLAKVDQIAVQDSVRHDDTHDPTIKALAEMLNAQGRTKSRKEANRHEGSAVRKPNGIEFILAQAGVQYFHENSEVIGTSKIESSLSKRAMRNTAEDDADMEVVFDDAAPDSEVDEPGHTKANHECAAKFRPPEAVRVRQFCTMAKFAKLSTVDFAMCVENWTQRDRREFLDAFYIMRLKMLSPRVA